MSLYLTYRDIIVLDKLLRPCTWSSMMSLYFIKHDFFVLDRLWRPYSWPSVLYWYLTDHDILVLNWLLHPFTWLTVASLYFTDVLVLSDHDILVLHWLWHTWIWLSVMSLYLTDYDVLVLDWLWRLMVLSTSKTSRQRKRPMLCGATANCTTTPLKYPTRCLWPQATMSRWAGSWERALILGQETKIFSSIPRKNFYRGPSQAPEYREALADRDWIHWKTYQCCWATCIFNMFCSILAFSTELSMCQLPTDQ